MKDTTNPERSFGVSVGVVLCVIALFAVFALLDTFGKGWPTVGCVVIAIVGFYLIRRLVGGPLGDWSHDAISTIIGCDGASMRNPSLGDRA